MSHIEQDGIMERGWPTEKAAKTVLKKISDEKILIKRYWSNGQLKYKAHLLDMPDELCDKPNGTEVIQDYESPENPDKFSARSTSKDGVVTWWYKNGQKRAEQYFKDGVWHGKQIIWFDDGQIQTEDIYKNGIIDGQQTYWFDDGQIDSKIYYKNGKQEGKWTFWHKNGKIEYEGNYKDGKKYGKHTTWFENGRRSLEENYKDGNKDGKWTYWWESGQIMIEKYYNNDKQVKQGKIK